MVTTVIGKWCGQADHDSGMDKTGMGRWSYILLKEKTMWS
jgi:hypothetical protein